MAWWDGDTINNSVVSGQHSTALSVVMYWRHITAEADRADGL